jgi:hypothetical protein
MRFAADDLENVRDFHAPRRASALREDERAHFAQVRTFEEFRNFIRGETLLMARIRTRV